VVLAAIGGPLLTLSFVRFHASQAWPVFSQRNFVRSALTSPLTNPKCSKRSTIELVLLERTSVMIGAPPSFNFDMRGGDALIPRCFGNAQIDYQ